MSNSTFTEALNQQKSLDEAKKTLKLAQKSVIELQAGQLVEFYKITPESLKAACVTAHLNQNEIDTIVPKFEAEKNKISKDTKEKIESLVQGITPENIGTLKTIDQEHETERLAAKAKADAATIEAYMHPKAKTAPAQLSSNQENTKARIAELEKAAASAPIQNNTPEDIARIAELDAATKTQRLDAAAARTAELQANLVGAKKTVAPVVTPVSADQANIQARMTKINTTKDTRAAATDAINAKSLETLSSDNNTQYESAVKSLTADLEKETDTVKRGAIGNKISSYEDAFRLRNMPKTDKLENERAFARALLELEARQ